MRKVDVRLTEKASSSVERSTHVHPLRPSAAVEMVPGSHSVQFGWPGFGWKVPA
jgi:hypothetical protein